MARFKGRRIRQILRSEFAFTRRGTEAALGKREVRLARRRNIQTNGVLAIQPFHRNTIEVGMSGVEHSTHHVIIGIPEAGILETHAQCNRSEYLDVRTSLSG